MATRTTRTSANGGSATSLAAAMTMLLQNQARFVAHLDEDRQRFASNEREIREIRTLIRHYDQMIRRNDQMIRRNDQMISRNDQIIRQHDQRMVRLEAESKEMQAILKNLPEAIRKRIGFQKN